MYVITLINNALYYLYDRRKQDYKQINGRMTFIQRNNCWTDTGQLLTNYLSS